MKSKRKFSFIIIMVILCITIVFFIVNKFGAIKYLTLKKENNELMEKLDKVNNKNQMLRSQIDSLKIQDSKIEKVAREKYNMKREGEKVIKIEYSK